MKKENNLFKIEREFIQAFGGLWSRWGLSRSAGLTLAALYLADADIPMSAGDLTQVLKISRSTLSSAISELSNAHLIEKVSSLGARGERYKTFSDIRELSLRVFGLFRHRDILPALSSLETSHQDASRFARDNEKIRRVADRVNGAKLFFKELDAWLDCVSRMTKLQLQHYMTLSEDELGKLLNK